MTNFSLIKRVLTKKADLAGWRLPDFRRSFATALGEAGFQEVILDAVLTTSRRPLVVVCWVCISEPRGGLSSEAP